jgi:Spy/CpxP family protein refolding chaperone
MKSKTSAALLLVAIFLLGAVAGGISYYLFQHHFVAAQPPRPRVPNSHDIVEEMAQQLSLDVRQKEQLRTIILRSREQYRTLSRQFQPQYETIRGETNEAIRGILNPDQKKHFDETLERMDARHRDRSREPSDPAK